MQPDKNMAQFVETKLTRTEAIDLIIDEMREELAQRQATLKNERDSILDTISAAELLPIIRTGDISIELPCSYRKGFSIAIRTGSLALTRFPTEIQKKLARLVEISDRSDELAKRLSEINDKSKIRNTILKAMLEGSDEGQKFLQLLTGLRLKVSPKLLGEKISKR